MDAEVSSQEDSMAKMVEDKTQNNSTPKVRKKNRKRRFIIVFLSLFFVFFLSIQFTAVQTFITKTALNLFVLNDKLNLEYKKIEINFFTGKAHIQQLELINHEQKKILQIPDLYFTIEDIINVDGNIILDSLIIHRPLYTHASDNFHPSLFQTSDDSFGVTLMIRHLVVHKGTLTINKNEADVAGNIRLPSLHDVQIELKDISLDDKYTFSIQHLSAKGEQSFQIQDAQSDVQIVDKHIYLNRAFIYLPHSNIHYSGIIDIEKKEFSLRLLSTILKTKDIEELVQAHEAIPDIQISSGDFLLSPTGVSVSKWAFSVDDDGDFDTNFNIDLEQKTFQSDVSFAGLNLYQILKQFPEKYLSDYQISDETLSFLKHIKNLGFDGKISGNIDRFQIIGETKYGKQPFEIDLISTQKNNRLYKLKGKILLSNADLQEWISKTYFGRASGFVEFEYVPEIQQLNVKTVLRDSPQSTLLNLQAQYKHDTLLFTTTLNNEKIGATFMASVSNDLVKIGKGQFVINYINLDKVGMAKKSIQFSTKGDVNFSYKNWDNLQSIIHMKNLRFEDKETTLSYDSLSVVFHNDEHKRTLSVQSDPLSLDFSGAARIDSLSHLIKQNISKKQAILDNLHSLINQADIAFDLSMKNLNPFFALFGIPLTLHETLNFRVTKNNDDENTTGVFYIGDFSYDNIRFEKLFFDSTISEDQFSIGASANALSFRLLNREHIFENLYLSSIINPQNLFFNLKIADPEKENYIDITGHTPLNLSETLTINLYPSTFLFDDIEWRNNKISSIVYHKDHGFEVEDIIFSRQNQQVRFGGKALKHKNSRLYLTLDNVHVNNFAFLFEEYGKPNATIHADLSFSSLFQDFTLRADANLKGEIYKDIDDFDLNFHADYLSSENKFNLSVASKDKHILADMGYDFKQQFPYGKLHFNNAKLNWLKNIFSPFAEDIDGSANLALSFEPRGKTIEGTIDVTGGFIDVKQANTKYRLENSTLNIKDKRLLLSDIGIYDDENNTGKMNGYVNLYDAFDYDIHIESDEIKALNTTFENNPVYYGLIYAAGNFNFRQHDKATYINIDIDAQDRSEITISSVDQSANTDNKMVYFIQPEALEKDIIEQAKQNFSTRYPVFLDLKVNVDDETKAIFLISNLDLTVFGQGALNINYQLSEGLNMSGDYVIERGKADFNFGVLNKLLSVSENSKIYFQGPIESTRIDVVAELSTKADVEELLLAVGNVNTSTFNLANSRIRTDLEASVKGEIYNPILDFKISFPNNPDIQGAVDYFLSDQRNMSHQALNLLLLNSFSSEGVQKGNASNGFSRNVNNFLQNQLTGRISQWFSNIISDNVDINIRSLDFSKQVPSVDFEGSVRFLNNRLILSFGLSQFDYEENPNFTNALNRTDFDRASFAYTTDTRLKYLLRKQGSFSIFLGAKTNVRSTLLLDYSFRNLGNFGLQYNVDFDRARRRFRKVIYDQK